MHTSRAQLLQLVDQLNSNIHKLESLIEKLHFSLDELQLADQSPLPSAPKSARLFDFSNQFVHEHAQSISSGYPQCDLLPQEQAR